MERSSDVTRHEVFTLVTNVLIKLRTISPEGKLKKIAAIIKEMFGPLWVSESLNDLERDSLMEILFEIGTLAVNEEYQTNEIREAGKLLDRISKRDYPESKEVRISIHRIQLTDDENEGPLFSRPYPE
jgi:hypothetical protein